MSTAVALPHATAVAKIVLAVPAAPGASRLCARTTAFLVGCAPKVGE